VPFDRPSPPLRTKPVAVVGLPAAVVGLPAAVVGLPAAVIPHDETHERLRLLVIVALGSFAVVGIIAWLMPLLLPPASPPTAVMGVLAVSVVNVCAAMFWLLRRPRAVGHVHALGMGFVVVVALLMAAAEVSLVPEINGARWGVSGIGIWIVLFPLVYPSSPRLTLVAALACASMVPLVYGGSRLIGAPSQSWTHLLPWMLPLYFCAGLAVVAAAGMHHYRQALAKAKQDLQEYGRYELVRPLGSGGMGEVWLARHRLLQRSAAIKFITPPATGDEAHQEFLVRQFKAEAAAIARLSSLHTVTLYDFGIADHGEWYYVMELLDGIDLEHAVSDHGPFPDWRVAQILAQACSSLAEAHRQGIVHRDIKPSNLMLCRLGETLDVVKVVDFGLVELNPSSNRQAGSPQAGSSQAGSSQARSSGLSGSVGYLAPEILLAEPALDGRIDLYALGCVGWWLLTAKPVFADAKNVEDECVRHCSEPPPRAILTAGGHDPQLVQLLIELLSKRPEARPASATATRQRLLSLPCCQRFDEAAVAAWWASTARPSERAPSEVSATRPGSASQSPAVR
jgi:serine/threonine-protein kinase